MMLWFKIACSVLLLVLLVNMLDIDMIWQQLRHADWWLVAAATLCLILAQLLSALRWAWLARGLGLTVRTGRKIQLYFLGMFLSMFLPSIIGGDVARGWLMARDREQAGWASAASVVLERLNGVIGLIIMIDLSMLFLDVPGFWLWSGFALLAMLFLVMLSVGFWWPVLQARKLGERWSGWQSLPLADHVFANAWMRALPVSVLFQSMVVQSHLFLGQAVGLELSWAAYAFIVCLVALASALPLSFNGFGIREGGYVGLAVWFGASAEAAAGMAILWVLVLAIAAIPGGIVLWRLGGRSALKRAGK